MPSKAQPIDAAIGMMDSAYFTSRKDVLDWINNLLSLNLTKIEQTATGAVACQMADFMFPGTLRVGKVRQEGGIRIALFFSFSLYPPPSSPPLTPALVASLLT